MSEYLLFGAKGCGSAITEGFLRWADIPYKYHELKWEERAQWPQVLGRYNSLPQVPTLILPNSEVLTETLATAVHANRYRPGLTPDTDQFWRWAVFTVANIYPTFTYRDNASQFVKDPSECESFGNKVMERRKGLWMALEKECGDGWFLGQTFSAMDVYLGFMTQWTPGREWFFDHCPRIMKVVSRVDQTEPFQSLMKEHS